MTITGGTGWINVFGLMVVILILIPNIIYAVKSPGEKNLCTNRTMNILEQVGRYGCMALMICDFGLEKSGFESVEMCIAYLIGNALLILFYFIIWGMYFYRRTARRQLAFAIIPTCIFLLCGITLSYALLIVFAVIFGVAHIFVTRCNFL